MKKCTRVALLGMLGALLASGGFYLGIAHQKARELTFRKTMGWYPATSFVDRFYPYMADIKYQSDLHRSDFPLGAYFHIDRPDAQKLIDDWVSEFEPTLTPKYGEGGWSLDSHAVTDGRKMAETMGLVDFTAPSFEVGYSVSHNEGGRFCILIDSTARWVFFYSHFSD